MNWIDDKYYNRYYSMLVEILSAHESLELPALKWRRIVDSAKAEMKRLEEEPDVSAFNMLGSKLVESKLNINDNEN